jgi:CysZ protein
LIGDIISGAGYFFRGFKLVREKGIRRYVLIPLIINTLVFLAAILIGIDQFENVLEWLLPGGNRWWAEFARVVLWIFFAVAALVILFFTFTVMANLFGAPFNGLLSEKVESHILGEKEEDSGGLKDFMLNVWPTLVSELRKITYFLILAGLVFLLTLIPLVNVASPLLWAIFTSWMLAVEYIAYPMENNKLYFSQVKNMLRQKRGIALGFGMTAMGVSLIPLLNFLVMPAAVAGATALWVEQLSDRALEKKVDPVTGTPGAGIGSTSGGC